MKKIIRKDVMKLKDWLKSNSFSLCLSSGFFGHFAHAGVLSCLEENELRPKRISGSSSGGLVGGLFASGMESRQMVELFLGIERGHFWDPAPGLGFLKGAKFKALLNEYLPVNNVEDCEIPLGLSLHNIFTHKTEVFKRGDLAQALVGTCAVPLLFRPVKIGLALYSDGGITDRPGIKGLGETEPILYHHLTDLFDPPGGTVLPNLSHKNVISLHFKKLPRVHPFALNRGHKAFYLAKSKMKEALEAPLKKTLLI